MLSPKHSEKYHCYAKRSGAVPVFQHYLYISLPYRARWQLRAVWTAAERRVEQRDAG